MSNVEPLHKDTGEAWLLTVFDVPAVPRYLSVVRKLGFRKSRKNPDNWWRRFEPWQEDRKDKAREILGALNQAGLRNRHWLRVAVKPQAKPQRARKLYAKPVKEEEYAPRPKTYRGYLDFAVHNSSPGQWRMRRGKRP